MRICKSSEKNITIFTFRAFCYVATTLTFPLKALLILKKKYLLSLKP